MEFSQRPAHSTLPGAHGYMGAPPTHYQQHTAENQPLYSTYAQQQQQQQPQQRTSSSVSASEAYPVAPRRLPSVSELLTPQDTTSNNTVQVAARTQRDTMPYTTQIMQVDRTHQQFASYPEPQQVFAIDVPGARAIQQQQQQASAEYLNYHRDSESASSVSSQGTLMDSRLSPIHHTYKRASIYQQHQQQQQYVQQPFASTPVADADRNMCEEDVFTAASILMSLRTCKMPC